MEPIIDLSVLLSGVSLLFVMLGLLALAFERFQVLLGVRQRRGRQRPLPAQPLQRSRPRRLLGRPARPANAAR
jgi:hypothetical protein